MTRKSLNGRIEVQLSWNNNKRSKDIPSLFIILNAGATLDINQLNERHWNFAVCMYLDIIQKFIELLQKKFNFDTR